MIILFLLILLSGSPASDDFTGVAFHFKNRDIHLLHPMRRSDGVYHPRDGLSNASLDTLSNFFDPAARHVEIIRQDHPSQPTMGLALAFEFDEANGEYPYTPAYAALQLKNFGWGGLEFSVRDTMNYTGVSNDVSDDFTIEIIDFHNDTITGLFSGLLLSGAGPMAGIEEGRFRVRLYRLQ
ncbi:MAG: hypothetical protein SFV22_10640 [Saprospiraceae bacterium]|nr:hypothetical protein [Saprospiraceae bacterium]